MFLRGVRVLRLGDQIYIHIYIYIYIYVHIYIYLFTYTRGVSPVCACACIHIHIYIYMCVHMFTHTDIFTQLLEFYVVNLFTCYMMWRRSMLSLFSNCGGRQTIMFHGFQEKLPGSFVLAARVGFQILHKQA